MSLKTHALDRMYEQVVSARRIGREANIRWQPKSRQSDTSHKTTLTGTRSLVRGNGHQDLLGRSSRYATSKLDKLAGRV